MKTLGLSFDKEGMELGAEDKKKTSEEMTVDAIKVVCMAWANTKRGMTEIDRRLYYKVCDDLELALKEKKTEVELEDNRMGFIRKCFREAMLMPNILLRKVEDLIEAVKDR